MADRQEAQRHLIKLLWITDHAWENKKWERIGSDGVQKYCIVWNGKNIRADVAVSEVTDFSSVPELHGEEVFPEGRSTPFYILPRLYWISKDLKLEVTRLAEDYPTGNY